MRSRMRTPRTAGGGCAVDRRAGSRYVRVIVGERDRATESRGRRPQRLRQREMVTAELVRGQDETGAVIGRSRSWVHNVEKEAFRKLGRALDALAVEPWARGMAVGVLGETGTVDLDAGEDWRDAEARNAAAMVRAELVDELGEAAGHAEADRIDRLREAQRAETRRKGAA